MKREKADDAAKSHPIYVCLCVCIVIKLTSKYTVAAAITASVAASIAAHRLTIRDAKFVRIHSFIYGMDAGASVWRV